MSLLRSARFRSSASWSVHPDASGSVRGAAGFPPPPPDSAASRSVGGHLRAPQLVLTISPWSGHRGALQTCASADESTGLRPAGCATRGHCACTETRGGPRPARSLPGCRDAFPPRGGRRDAPRSERMAGPPRDGRCQGGGAQPCWYPHLCTWGALLRVHRALSVLGRARHPAPRRGCGCPHGKPSPTDPGRWRGPQHAACAREPRISCAAVLLRPSPASPLCCPGWLPASPELGDDAGREAAPALRAAPRPIWAPIWRWPLLSGWHR